MNALADLTEIKNSYTYDGYKQMVIAYAENHVTSGKEQLLERVEATKLNAQRMKRIDKQVVINEDIKSILKNLHEHWTWILIAETWCGDGAQNIPVIAKIKELSPFIDLKIILRDENPEIMDAYLTNGSRCIPKLICINTETKEEIGTWGPRPSAIQQMVKEYKMLNPNVAHDIFIRNLHLWYARDLGKSIQHDLEQLLWIWVNKE